MAGPDLVVTNAHVVAGEDDTTVTTRAGATLDASAVHFEPRNDLAILRVPGLDAPPLRLAPQVLPGTAGAVLGYPENGSFAVSPARIGRTGQVISQDSYGRGPVEREMTPFRGRVRSGNSGGPAVDASGRVLTTVFAAQRGSGIAGRPRGAEPGRAQALCGAPWAPRHGILLGVKSGTCIRPDAAFGHAGALL